MPRTFHHQEKKIVAFNDDHLYAIVKDVARYPEFLPWCLAAEVVEKGQGFFTADLTVGARQVRERFRSTVRYDDQEKKITTSGNNHGPLSTMESNWHFKKINDQQCEIDFSVTMRFSSFLTEALFSFFLDDAIKKITAAFLARATALQNNP